MSKKFKRLIEDFECENCGAHIKGDGYTNHCPSCLWSKHVDIFPGDRASKCNGMMPPNEVTKESVSYTLVHRCLKCSHTKKNKLSKNDNMDSVIELARKLANKNQES